MAPYREATTRSGCCSWRRLDLRCAGSGDARWFGECRARIVASWMRCGKPSSSRSWSSKRGNATFFHGRSGAWSLVTEILIRKGLLPPGTITLPPCLCDEHQDTAWEKISTLFEEDPTTSDREPPLRARVISVNYALFGNTTLNPRNRGRGRTLHYTGEGSIDWALASYKLEGSGRRRGTKTPGLLESVGPETREMFQREWPRWTEKGELLLISIPMHLVRHLLYDSRAFGYATGRDIIEVLNAYDQPCFPGDAILPPSGAEDEFWMFNEMQARILDLCFREWAWDKGVVIHSIPVHFEPD